MDSRTSSILINLDIDIDKNFVVNQYITSKEKIEESQAGPRLKTYDSIRSAIKECCFVGSLKYGNNFIM